MLRPPNSNKSFISGNSWCFSQICLFLYRPAELPLTRPFLWNHSKAIQKSILFLLTHYETSSLSHTHFICNKAVVFLFVTLYWPLKTGVLSWNNPWSRLLIGGNVCFVCVSFFHFHEWSVWVISKHAFKFAYKFTCTSSITYKPLLSVKKSDFILAWIFIHLYNHLAASRNDLPILLRSWPPAWEWTD